MHYAANQKRRCHRVKSRGSSVFIMLEHNSRPCARGASRAVRSGRTRLQYTRLAVLIVLRHKSIRSFPHTILRALSACRQTDRVAALCGKLGRAVFREEAHHHVDVPGADGQVHRTADGRHGVRPADVPVGQVAGCGDLKSAQDADCQGDRRGSARTSPRGGSTRRLAAR
jgi:hypothetical protein